MTQLSQREWEVLQKLQDLDPNDEDDREQLRLYEAELFASSSRIFDDEGDQAAETAWLDDLRRQPNEWVATADDWPANTSEAILARLLEMKRETGTEAAIAPAATA